MRACIAIIDAARARLFTYEGFELQEVADFANPGRRVEPRDRVSDPRAGSSRGPAENRSAMDDHREAKVANADLEHAKCALAELARVLAQHELQHVIVVASPHMLGMVRQEGKALFARDGLVVDEIARDFTHLTVSQIHDHLAQLHLIPARPRMQAVR